MLCTLEDLCEDLGFYSNWDGQSLEQWFLNVVWIFLQAVCEVQTIFMTIVSYLRFSFSLSHECAVRCPEVTHCMMAVPTDWIQKRMWKPLFSLLRRTFKWFAEIKNCASCHCFVFLDKLFSVNIHWGLLLF